jgi:hypothetical protein
MKVAGIAVLFFVLFAIALTRIEAVIALSIAATVLYWKMDNIQDELANRK